LTAEKKKKRGVPFEKGEYGYIGKCEGINDLGKKGGHAILPAGGLFHSMSSTGSRGGGKRKESANKKKKRTLSRGEKYELSFLSGSRRKRKDSYPRIIGPQGLGRKTRPGSLDRGPAHIFGRARKRGSAAALR